MRIKDIIGLWIPPGFLMGLIFVFSTRQNINVSETFIVNFLLFKTLHILEYALLFLLLYRAFIYGSVFKSKKVLPLVFFVTLLYAASDELHQMFVPTRQGSFRDVIIDGIGALFAWIFLLYISPKLPRKLKSWQKRWQLF